NGRPLIPLARWGRWIALGFLFFCPLFAFLFDARPFPFGGALGNGLFFWTNGFAGKAGTILMLTGVFCFFAFIVFQWDIKPLLSKARKILPASFPVGGLRPAVPTATAPSGPEEGRTDDLHPVSAARLAE